MSTSAAELVALFIAEDRTVQSVKFIENLGLRVTETKLYEDNQAVIDCCQKNSLSHTRKLVDILMMLIRERITDGYYCLEYVYSAMNIADMFTKALSAISYKKLVQRLFIEDEDDNITD